MKTGRRIPRWLGLAAISLLVLSMLGAIPGPGARAGTAQTPPSSKIDSRLGLLLSLHTQDIPVNPDTSLGQELAEIRVSGVVEINARFARELSPAERAEIEALGVEFQTVAGQLAHLGPFYGILVPVDAVDDLTANPLAVWLEATWRPTAPAPLDISVTYDPARYTYVDAPGVWFMNSPFTGLPLTGQGTIVANFDTGVDVRHPAFLNGTYGTAYNNWDTNGDGVFTPNVDQIGGVVLRYWNAPGDPNNTGGFDVTQDWVWGDANVNWAYDWTETVYMAYDVSGDGTLQASEFLIDRGTLGPGIPTSKVLATLNNGGVQRTRGNDLHLTDPDNNGHGTSVTGILGAGAVYSGTYPAWPFIRRYTGMAPDADLLVADRLNNAETAYIPWAQGLGAKVMLYEFGGWVYEYMDGSSNIEQMMDAASALGILQVVPTGNLHCAGTWGCNPRHLQYPLPPQTWFNHLFNVPPSPPMTDIYGSMIWLNPSNNMMVQFTTPNGFPAVLPCTSPPSGWQYVTTGDGHQIGCNRVVDSSRGTARYDIWINRAGNIATGNWTMWVLNNTTSPEVTNFYIFDSTGGWAFGAGWINAGPGQELHTATVPSTCDSCLGVASYATRANSIGTPGALSWFSGRGPRFFDGARIVDISAPGHYDIITPQSQYASGFVGSYNGTFGGTSAAGPHAAGLAVLLYQFANNDIAASHIAEAIMRGAESDMFTGSVPNDNWGYGKLRSPESLFAVMHDLGDAPASDNNAGLPMDAYPSVPANFPTVFGASIPGPLHWTAGSLWTGPFDSGLGLFVSAEGEADMHFDEDSMIHNIEPTLNQGDLDAADDGLTFPGDIPHCAPRTFTVTVFVQPYLDPSPTRYVNAWMDWNADGDWGDLLTCSNPNDTPEWVLQDHPLVGPGTYVIPFTVMTYRGSSGGDPLWMRVTVGEQQAPLDPGTSRADGRGPAAGYAYGETEDYLYPETSFLAPPSACVSDTVAFSHKALASSWPMTFTWDFGDGTIVTNPGPDPTHHYTALGNFIVALSAESTMGVFSIYTQTVQIGDVPDASFISDSPVCPGQTMHFTDTSVAATSWTWDFGGPGTPGGTPQNPTFLYDNTGDYNVTLTATSSCGEDVYQDTVQVQEPLTGVSISGPDSLTVGETGVYTATPAPPDATDPQYAWSNGASGATTTYSWGTPGSYTIVVTASNDCSLVTETKEVLVSAGCISLTGVSIAGPAGLLVGEGGTYQATPEPPNATDPAYLWSNGSTAASAVYSWTLPGTYDVVVTATNCQSVVVSDTYSVVVTSECVSLTGVSIAGPAALEIGEEGTYRARPAPITATNPAFLWNDGTTGATAVYSWTTSGTYTVSVTATNCQSVVVGDSMSVTVWETLFRIYLPLVLRNY